MRTSERQHLRAPQLRRPRTLAALSQQQGYRGGLKPGASPKEGPDPRTQNAHPGVRFFASRRGGARRRWRAPPTCGLGPPWAPHTYAKMARWQRSPCVPRGGSSYLGCFSSIHAPPPCSRVRAPSSPSARAQESVESPCPSCPPSMDEEEGEEAEWVEEADAGDVASSLYAKHRTSRSPESMQARAPTSCCRFPPLTPNYRHTSSCAPFSTRCLPPSRSSSWRRQRPPSSPPRSPRCRMRGCGARRM